MSVAVSFKVPKQDRKFINDKINEYAKNKRMKKGDAFVRIMKDYFSKDHLIDDADSVSIENVLYAVECHYLKVIDDETFACYELVHKQKAPKPLGIISEAINVIELCRSCQNRKVELHNLQIQKELKKVNIKKLEEFMKHYTQLTKDGTEVISHLCLGDTASSALIFSYDGLFLPCPLLKNIDEETGLEYKEVVNIESICKMKINPETREKPCEYLALIPHIISMHDIIKDNAESTLDPWVDEDYPFLKALEDKVIDEESETIEADFEVIEKEENEKVK